MYPLNLPSYDAKIRKINNNLEIFDPLRNKFVTLTPEEWVRQHFVNFLISEKEYPKSLMANEESIIFNNQSRRCDTVVYNKTLDPLMIIEYKKSELQISQKIFDQVVRYNSVLKVNYIIVSNGINHYCCEMDYKNHSFKYLTDIPNYNELISSDY